MIFGNGSLKRPELRTLFRIFDLKKEVIMGRGDKRSRKGKIFAGSYGKTRPKHKKATAPAQSVEKAPKSKGKKKNTEQ
jgi:30S ribosomal protein S31